MNPTLFREHLRRKHKSYSRPLNEDWCPSCHQETCTCNQQNEDNTEYQAYFRKMLDKHGYATPKDIPDDKKDDFFNAVDKGWQSNDEKNESAADKDVTLERP